LISATIRPDPGFRLDHAFITTFTMELAAMLAVPVALSFQEWDEETAGDERGLAPVAILDAVRRHASNLTVVAESGRIAVPRKPQSLLPLLEGAIHTVTKPGGTFHPKVWVLRYVPADEGTDETRYRVICSSRNLTFSRAWDAAVVLDGKVSEDENAGRGEELSGFVEGVVGLIDAGPARLDQDRAEKLRLIAEECRRIRFDLPDGIDDFSMHSIGLGKGFDFRPAAARNRRLTISPFLGDSVVEELAGPESTLVSRQEELDALSVDPTETHQAVYVLSDLTDAESEGEEPVGDDLAGLHAKVFVEDRGWSSRIVLGSANASEKAFESNVEFIVALDCRMKRSGVDAILGDSKSGLLKVLNPYVRNEPVEVDPDLREAERAVEQTVRRLASAKFELGINSTLGGESGIHDLTLSVAGPRLDLDDKVEIECRPVTLDRDRLAKLSESTGDLATWPRVPTPRVTSLIAFQVSAGKGEARTSDSFVAKVRLANPLPEDRDGSITRLLISSKERLLSYLAFLLADPNREPGDLEWIGAVSPTEVVPPRPGPASGATATFPLMERLVQAVDRDPVSLDQVAGIIAELKKTEEGRDLLPEGFEAIWGPVHEARIALREEPQ
jgi:hypothetical protein